MKKMSNMKVVKRPSIKIKHDGGLCCITCDNSQLKKMSK